MEKRPKLKLVLTTADRLFELVGWILMLLVWGLTIANYPHLPDTIPTHYNGLGQADGFGGKSSIFTLPLIATILFIGLTVLNKFPHIFNYTTCITKDNALRQYTIATRLIRYLKFIIVLIFGLISFMTIQCANSESEGLGAWFLPLILGFILIPLAIYIIKSLKAK